MRASLTLVALLTLSLPGSATAALLGGSEATCTTPLAQNAACLDTTECADGLFCKPTAGQPARCAPKVARGGVCHDARACASGLACKYGADGASGTCVPQVARGASCDGFYEPDAACQGTDICQFGSLICAAQPTTVGAIGPFNAMSFAGKTCGGGLVSRTDQVPARCGPAVALAPASLLAAVKRDPNTARGAYQCAVAGICQAGAYCDLRYGVCVPDKGVGGDCTNGNECGDFQTHRTSKLSCAPTNVLLGLLLKNRCQTSGPRGSLCRPFDVVNRCNAGLTCLLKKRP